MWLGRSSNASPKLRGATAIDIRSGAVRTYKLLADGRRQIIGFYFPGEIFGLTLDKGHAYGYSADAITNVEARVFANATLGISALYDSALARRLLELRDGDLQAAKIQILLLGRMRALNPGDLAQVDTLDVRPLSNVHFKHFMARGVTSVGLSPVPPEVTIRERS